MAWYDDVNFYEIQLISGKWEHWITPISFQEAKTMIGSQSFITITYRAEDVPDKELNTKVIESIKDTTLYERKSRREEQESKEKRYSIIKEIRSIPLSRFYKWKFGLTKNTPKELDWFDKAVGIDIDPLMGFNEDYLQILLGKCKEKQVS